MIDVLTATQFQEELRRAARLDAPCALENPLAEAVQQIQKNPTYTQSRLLTRILDALTYTRGDFRRAEISALDSSTRAIVIALMDSLRAGTTARTKWEEAVNSANLAQFVAGG
jgi:hypothetical protein